MGLVGNVEMYLGVISGLTQALGTWESGRSVTEGQVVRSISRVNGLHSGGAIFPSIYYYFFKQ